MLATFTKETGSLWSQGIIDSAW